MKQSPLTIALAVALVVVSLVALKNRRDAQRAAGTLPQSDESEELHALFAEDWDKSMERNPTWASALGDRRWNDQWGDASAEGRGKANAWDLSVLAKLSEIKRDKLPPVDQTNYDLFKRSREMAIGEYDFGWHLIALNQRGGIQTEDELGDTLRFANEKDYEDWIARLENLPVYVGQTQALLAQGVETGMLLPMVIMQRIPSQIEKQIVTDARKSPFFKPFEDFPDGIEVAAQERLAAAGAKVIGEKVVPAYAALKEFFEGTYLPACPEEVGAWKLPKGEAMYAFFCKKFTTTEMSPDEIHEIGLNEVARIRAQMEEIKEKVEFAGTLKEFFDFLRTDPQFYFESSAELLAGYQAVSKRVDPLMVKVSRNLPRTPYGVQAIPDKIAPDTTAAYYRQPAADGTRAGSYFVNLYRPETRPKWEMMALSLHEAVPGHHLQIALAQELGELPKFRRYGGYTAYVEGWALYAEHLGEELGLYDDPYDKFGQLTYEMWRAIRLVVDTGIHHKRWTRQEAIDYFLDNAPKTELDVTNEIDRYIAWPGQALAYKIGELKIKALRKRAEAAKGESFDLKAFHDVILSQGAVTLDVLERTVDAWLAE